MGEQGQALGKPSERAGWGNLCWVGKLVLGGLDSQWERIEVERGGLGGTTACLKGCWGCGVAEFGKRITERGLGARRDGKYKLWVSLLEESVLSLSLFLCSMKIN